MKVTGSSSSAFGASGALLTALLVVTSAEALSFPILGQSRSAVSGLLGKRTVDIGAFGNGSTIVQSDADTVYSAKLTLGGSEFKVLIDTGSSDLWVIGNVPGTKNLSIETEVTYASGSAKGFINTAEMVFDDFTVKDQAYINVIPSSDNPDTQGLIGLGPASLSNIRSKVKSSSGAPPLDRIFRQNTSTPNFISVLLTRETDANPGGTSPQAGQLTIGSVIPTLEDVTKQKKLPALQDQFGIQHWQTLLDENGIIGSDGKNITTNTSIPNPAQGNAHQFHVIFDTGFTYPQVPREIADAIYGRVPDAVFVPQQGTPGYWRVPCDYELNVTFSFGGVKYPIAPLDLTTPEQTDSSGKAKTCMSTFQQIAPSVADHQNFGAFDAILGMAFLRNTYLLINFGDFVDGSNSSVADPYIQLLSVTNPGSAHTDFVNARLGGVDTTTSQAALLSEADAKHSPETTDDADTDSLKSSFSRVKDQAKNLFYKTWWFIVVVSVAGALLLGAIAFCIFSRLRTRRSRVRMEGGFRPAMVGTNSYAPLVDNVSRPQGAQYAQSYGAGGYPAGQYAEPRYDYHHA